MRILLFAALFAMVSTSQLPAQERTGSAQTTDSVLLDGLYYEVETDGMFGAIRFFGNGQFTLIYKPYYYGKFGIPSDHKGVTGAYRINRGTIELPKGPVEYLEPEWNAAGNRCLQLKLIAPGKIRMTYEFVRSTPNHRFEKDFAYRSDSEVKIKYEEKEQAQVAERASARVQREDKVNKVVTDREVKSRSVKQEKVAAKEVSSSPLATAGVVGIVILVLLIIVAAGSKPSSPGGSDDNDLDDDDRGGGGGGNQRDDSDDTPRSTYTPTKYVEPERVPPKFSEY